MLSRAQKLMLKENGKVLMDALRTIETSPTLVNLSRHIATTYSSSIDRVKHPLKKTLERCMDVGVITRKRGKYYVYGEELSDEEQSDATRRRRRGRSSGRKRPNKSRSRSRSLRRRRRR